jgi:predicted nucleotidyltransferase
MMFGLTPGEYAWILDEVVAPLTARGAQVYCYGSRARGDHGPHSDLDLMVEAKEDLSALVSLLQERLTESNFPYKVDLVQFRHFADAYKAGYLNDRVPFRL